ncbi:hypothetical protein COO91_04872 [Nostoc flagelliforme CCNUN1]|uniref:Uncharacterized protein n=1 Tax=Nostoc flagelliforme CCNUN1 TaxID=2038116 RepID=A0A2K8SVU9_9NOSO|nr:hypothetical protein COO91_04872 [Nostoc flagelliforme CCNUN1]
MIKQVSVKITNGSLIVTNYRDMILAYGITHPTAYISQIGDR